MGPQVIFGRIFPGNEAASVVFIDSLLVLPPVCGKRICLNRGQVRRARVTRMKPEPCQLVFHIDSENRSLRMRQGIVIDREIPDRQLFALFNMHSGHIRGHQQFCAASVNCKIFQFPQAQRFVQPVGGGGKFDGLFSVLYGTVQLFLQGCVGSRP